MVTFHMYSFPMLTVFLSLFGEPAVHANDYESASVVSFSYRTFGDLHAAETIGAKDADNGNVLQALLDHLSRHRANGNRVYKHVLLTPNQYAPGSLTQINVTEYIGDKHELGCKNLAAKIDNDPFFDVGPFFFPENVSLPRMTLVGEGGFCCLMKSVIDNNAVTYGELSIATGSLHWNEQAQALTKICLAKALPFKE